MRQRTAMQDELDENQNKTDEELKRLGFGFRRYRGYQIKPLNFFENQKQKKSC